MRAESEPAAVLAQVGTPRKSSARDDAALLSTSARVIRHEDAREITGHLSDEIDERLNHVYTPVRQHDALAVFDLLLDVIVTALPDILSVEYEPDGKYSANFMSVHKKWWQPSSVIGDVSRTTLWNGAGPLRKVPLSTCARGDYRSLRFFRNAPKAYLIRNAL